MMRLLKRYRYFVVVLAAYPALWLFRQDAAAQALHIAYDNILEMLAVIPPIFILLGLLDVWVKRETMVKYLGEKSGLTGILIAFTLGSAAAGPLYAAFPVAGLMLKKGTKLSNVFIFIGAWSTTKIPLLMFETAALGLKFTVIRLLLNLPVIILIALISEKFLSLRDKAEIYEKAANDA